MTLQNYLFVTTSLGQDICLIRTHFFGGGVERNSSCKSRKRNHNTCAVRLECSSEIVQEYGGDIE